jgi:hypothetical protein
MHDEDRTGDRRPTMPSTAASVTALRTWAANGCQLAHAELNRRGGLAVAA